MLAVIYLALGVYLADLLCRRFYGSYLWRIVGRQPSSLVFCLVHGLLTWLR